MFINSIGLKNDFFVKKSSLDFESLDEFDIFFPFDLDCFSFFENYKLEFNSNVTFFVGDNGCGKTTFVESLAYNLGVNRFGGGKNFIFNSLDKPILSEFLEFERSLEKPKDIFFFRAENFFNLEQELKDYSYSGEKKKDLVYDYTGSNKNFREMSHGQGFKAFFENRIRENGIYIFDEPESALSVESQIEFLFLLKELSRLNNQIFIVTHSPIILSFPDAEIFDVSLSFEKVKYKDCSQLNDYLNFFKNVNMYRDKLKFD